MSLKGIVSWKVWLVLILMMGWCLTPRIAIGLNLGLIVVQVVLNNPIDLAVGAYGHFMPKSDISLDSIDRELQSLEQRTKSPWPRDDYKSFKPKI